MTSRRAPSGRRMPLVVEAGYTVIDRDGVFVGRVVPSRVVDSTRVLFADSVERF